MKKNQKYVYVALLYIPSSVGRFVKFWTRYGYSHVTFSFDENLETNHAFSRIKEYTPFVGGYTIEHKSYYTSGKDIKINTIIYKIPVTNEEYSNIRQYIEDIQNDNEYLYNMFSMCTLAVIGGFKVYKAMHCTEFVAKILTMISSVKMSKKWYKYLPKDFNNDLKEFTIFDGIMDTSNANRDENDYFFQPVDKKTYKKKYHYIFKELIYRMIHKKCSPNYDYRKVKF